MAEPLINYFTEGDVSLPDEISEKKIINIARGALERMETVNVSVSIIITDDRVIHEINREYRQKDRPTDVISFAYRDDPFPEIDIETEELGDIYISIDRTIEQAREYGVTNCEEMKRLLIHGVLHLLGFDHEKSKEEELRMQQKEEELFNLL